MVSFLAEVPDGEFKATLREHFAQSCSLARRYHPQFLTIRKVKKCQHNVWSSDGTICFNPCEEIGTLYHEVFHSAFHPSEFHEGHNEQWGDAFCDAFRYFVEKSLKSEGEWHAKLIRYCRMSFQQVMCSSGDQAHDRKHAYPASLIIRRVGPQECEERLLTFWMELRRQASKPSGLSLDGCFCYSIHKGGPTAVC